MRMKPVSKALTMATALAFQLIMLGCGSGSSPLSGGQQGCTNNCPPNNFLFAAGRDQIMSFKINSTTGALGPATITAGPNQSLGIFSTPTTGFLYVSDFQNDTVWAFTINPSTGALTAVSGSPFLLGGTPPGAGGFAWDLNGGYLYATDVNANAVAAFAILGSDHPNPGALQSISGSPYSVSTNPMQATVANNGLGTSQFLYVSNLNDSAGGISAFAIDPNTGALTVVPSSPFPTGTAGSLPGPSALVAVQGTGTSEFVYVALAGTVNANNKIVGFASDRNTGILTPIGGSPFTTGKNPSHMVLDPTGKFLYVANVMDDTISGFIVDGDTGALAPMPDSPFVVGSSVGGMAARDRFLYVADPQGNTIKAFTIDNTSTTSTGTLTPFSTPAFAAGAQPMLLTIAQTSP